MRTVLLVVFSVCALTVRAAFAGQDHAPAASAAGDELAALKLEGEVIYARECAPCHGADGTGDGAGPALAGEPALARKDLVILRILDGGKGMDPFAKVLTDREVAAVGTFVANAWENANGLIREADVKLSRAALETGKKP